jgi:hypothetical protein
MTWAVLPSVILIAGLVTGCYDPKGDIEAFRPEGEKRIAAMLAVAKTVEALPELHLDTLQFPNPQELDFESGESQNVAVAHLVGLAKPYEAVSPGTVAHTRFWENGAALLRKGTMRFGGKPKKKFQVDWAFNMLRRIQYVVVLREGAKTTSSLTDLQTFASGWYGAEAFLCRLDEAGTCFGGVQFFAQNSPDVKATVKASSSNAEKGNALKSRLADDLDSNARAALRDALAKRLVGAKLTEYF